MHRPASRAIGDLVPARRAIGHDERRFIRIANGGQQVKLRHFARDLRCFGLIAEGPGHAATRGLDGLDGEARDPGEQAFGRGQHILCLLMAMAVQERPVADLAKGQVEAAILQRARQIFLEQHHATSQAFVPVRNEPRHLVAEGQEA